MNMQVKRFTVHQSYSNDSHLWQSAQETKVGIENEAEGHISSFHNGRTETQGIRALSSE